MFAKGSGTDGVGRRQRSQGRAGPTGGAAGRACATRPETIRLLFDHALQDWRDVVAARIDRPVLMVGGRESQLWLCEHATVAVADNQFGRAVVIEDCGHMVTFDDLDWFNEVLLDFLRTTPVAG